VFALCVVAGVLIAFGPEPGTDVSNSTLGIAAIGLTAVGWLGQALWRQGLDLPALFGPTPSSLSAWGTILVGVLALDLFNSAEFHLLVPWLEQVSPWLADRYVKDAVSPTGPIEYLRVAGSAVIVAPLVEEFFVRGLMYQRWAYAWDRPVLALLVTSVLFALPHGHVLGTFVVGVVATLLYVRTRSLWAPIGMHAIENAIAVFGGLPVEAGFEFITGGAGDDIFGGGSLAVSGILLAWLLRRCGGALYEPLPYVEHERHIEREQLEYNS
jgi:membrane protease YdiL (CAAX protease family)